jgi:hypothetical protein
MKLQIDVNVTDTSDAVSKLARLQDMLDDGMLNGTFQDSEGEPVGRFELLDATDPPLPPIR